MSSLLYNHTFTVSYIEALDELSPELLYTSNHTFTFSYIAALDELSPEL
jgi:hypothetical protein